ncbi:MAG: pilus assembly protein TadG-related protein [Actinobacteria bacterium]|nr:pilus assembly protein TadG-related protein [Actinomycetota bacterium]
MKTQQKKKYLRRRHRSKEKGQMMILSVLIIVFAVVPLSAIGVDLGLMQWQKAKLQRVTDASALAGVQEMGKKQSANEPANTTTYRSAGVAITYAQQNGLQISTNYNTSGLEYTSSGTKDSIDIQAGNYNVSSDTFTPYTTPVNAISVGVTRTVPVYFGRIFGISSTQIKSVAIARIGQAKNGTYDSYPGLLPIGVPYQSFDPDEMYQLKGINFEDAAPGYKGILNFDKRWWHCATWNNETEKWSSTCSS